MEYYYKCFNKKICIKLEDENINMLNFWLERFCTNIEIIDKCEGTIDLHIEFKNSKYYDYFINENETHITICGAKTINNSFIAKFITQCFQKLLIEEDILIIPAACVCNYQNSCLLIIGDFWQGKTSVSMNLASIKNNRLISDNYVAIKNEKIIGATKYISIRKEDIKDNKKALYNINDRFFYKNEFEFNKDLDIIGFLLPYINNGDNNIHIISKEESKWYLYQKFSRLLCGETVLFDGKLPSPIFFNKTNSSKILKMVDRLLINREIKYVSSSINNIIKEGNEMICKGKMNNE